MKKQVLILIALFTIYSSAVAQDCKNFIYMTSGKVVKYSSTNPKGKLTSKMVYTVKAKTGNKATVNSQVFDDKGKEITSANSEMVCEGNNLKIDMRNFMPSANSSQFKGMTAKEDVSYLSYPTKMSTGQTLPDGSFNMQMFKDDQKMADMAFSIVDRKVEGTESVTTPAGTYECYKISYSAEIKTTTFGISIPINMKITEWYSAKLGLYVKSEANSKNGKLMSTTTLESVN
jgi:hypothetical protein